MVEVFKTNVTEDVQGRMLLYQIHLRHGNYKANFDLDDCDRILRVDAGEGMVDVPGLLDILKEFGFEAQVLEDDIPVCQLFHV